MPTLAFTNLLGSDIAIGNADGYGKSFTIPPAGSTVVFTGVQLESCGPQLDAMKTAGYLSWVKSNTAAVSDDLEILAGAGRAALLPAVVPAAKSATAVHAAIRGDTPITAVTTGLTNPVTPRNVSGVFGADWDGGDLVVVGTNQFDEVQTETIADNPGNTVYGVKVFKTVTSVAHTDLGTDASGTNTVTVGTGDKIGVAYDVTNTTGILHVDGVVEAVTMDATYDAFTPTSAPNGALSYVLLANIAG